MQMEWSSSQELNQGYKFFFIEE